MVTVQVLSTPDCPSCKVVLKTLDELKTEFENLKVDYVKDVTQKPDLMAKYQIMSAPGIVIKGKLIFQGGASKSQLKEEIIKAGGKLKS